MARRGRPKKNADDGFTYKLGPLTFRGERHTLEETAQELGMTKQGVLAIEKRALEKLRIGLAKYGITSLADVLDPQRCSNQDQDRSIYNTL